SPLLTLPVIRLLHAAQGGKVISPLPIAEVLTSGLVVRKLEPPTNTKGDEEASAKPLEPEQFQFEVLSEVAALLQQQLSATERRDVISRVSALVERRWNRIRRSDEPSFEAVLCDPTAQPPERLKNGLVQFASVTARLLDTLPGEEAKAFAERIRQGSGLPPGSPWPSSIVFDDQGFETAQLVNVPQLETFPVTTAQFAEVELQRIAFKTATLQPDVTPMSLDGEAWAFHDPLQRNHFPFGATAEKGDPLALTLVEIPAGSFQMGSPPDEPERSADEGPQHEVTLQSFFISQTPITQAQWRQVAQWSEQPGEQWGLDLNPNPSRFSDQPDSDQRPVEQVSWQQAMEFCNRLSQRTGRHYILPSEAQWEYACRAGTTTTFHFGARITTEVANYNGTYTYADGPKGAYREQTTAVRTFPANAWGLYDMHGNVYEWCLDHWYGSYEGAPTDGSAWLNPTEPNNPGISKGDNESSSDEKPRLLRGGSWDNSPGDCRSAYRFLIQPDNAYIFIGFRVVCLPQGPSLNP
ncbi:MAG: formylglycine-generating enzyme family protein, partial [Cyanobacteriota bacterium]|nr:formylglycine-generating enzyme family protein [Cyanobacteriota bacterium]